MESHQELSHVRKDSPWEFATGTCSCQHTDSHFDPRTVKGYCSVICRHQFAVICYKSPRKLMVHWISLIKRTQNKKRKKKKEVFRDKVLEELKRTEWTYLTLYPCQQRGPKGLPGQVSLLGSPLLDTVFSQPELAVKGKPYIDMNPKAKTRTEVHLKGQCREGDVC